MTSHIHLSAALWLSGRTVAGQVFLDWVPGFFKWSGYVLAGIVLLFLAGELIRTWNLLRRSLDREWAGWTLIKLLVLGGEARSLYQVARLRIESELLAHRSRGRCG